MGFNKRATWLVVLLLVALVAVNVTIFHGLRGVSVKGGSSGLSYFMEMNFSLSEIPRLGDVATVTAIMVYHAGGNGLSEVPIIVNVTLPSGIDLVSGGTRLEETLFVQNGLATTSFSIRVRPTQIGNWTIQGFVRTPPGGDSWVGAKDFVYLEVREDETILHHEPFPEYRECPPGQQCTTGGLRE